MVETLIFDPINRFSWSVAILVLFICGTYFLNQGLKRDDQKERTIMIGFASVFFGQALNRFFFFFSDFFVEGHYSGHSFYGDYATGGSTYMLFVILAYVSFLVSMCVFFFAIERILKKSRYSIFTLNVIFIALLIGLPIEYKRTAVYIFIVIDALLFFLVIFWFFKKSSPQFQAVSTLMMIGYILYLFGTIMDSSIVKQMNLTSPTYASFLIIIGAFISISPMIIKSELLSRSLMNWIIFSFFILVILGFGMNLIIRYELPELFSVLIYIAMVIGFGLWLFSLNRIYRTLKPPKLMEKIEKEQSDSPDFLKIFTRPKKLTEQEVTLYKEQKICLVCKNKVSKTLYLCPKCSALYCVKCSQMLSKAENSCWVCNAPFDDSLPTTPHEEEHQRIEESSPHKKK